MSGAILRIAGAGFDVDAFLAECPLEPTYVWRTGKPRFPRARPEGPMHETSGANFEVSAADFSELSTQFDDARAFFNRHADLIRGLSALPGVDGVVLDFGAEIHAPLSCSFTLPPDLLVLIGGLGVSVMLSVYPVEDEI